MNFRVGFGFDVHRLETGYDLTIGGIIIPHTTGSVGHSDGDVLIHAICDALLGAASLRDIGIHFPDTDNSLKGIDSKIILSETMKLIRGKGYRIGNVDSTICLQAPKIKDFIPEMCNVLAPILEIPVDDISVKATTTEKMGFIGKEEGLSAYAIVLIFKE